MTETSVVPPPPGPVEPAPSRKGLYIGLGVLGVIVLLTAGGALFLLIGAGPNTDLRRPMTDGRLEFTVDGVKCGPAPADSDKPFGPDTQECRVSMAVRNTGADVWNWSAIGQQASGGKGCRDGLTGCSAFVSGGLFVGETKYHPTSRRIEPGATIQALLAFHVPADSTLTELTLHDDYGTHGVTIRVAAT